MKALVVDDEKLIVKGLKFSLEQDGYEVDCAYDGQEAIDKARDKEYDIMLLDLMLPVFDGYQVCQQVREFSDVPIIMLTAKGEDMDKILGLEYGADDYITKPFNILEVKARIKAIIRRNRRKTPAVQEEPKVIVSGSMRLDIDAIISSPLFSASVLAFFSFSFFIFAAFGLLIFSFKSEAFFTYFPSENHKLISSHISRHLSFLPAL